MNDPGKGGYPHKRDMLLVDRERVTRVSNALGAPGVEQRDERDARNSISR